MVWDVSQPTDTTKIRNLGTVIRPNWQAIQEADSTFKPYALNLDNRTPLAVPNDPAAIADSYILYCKDDAAGDPQLFGIDASSNIVQFTGGAPTLATAGRVFLPGGLLLQWNRVSAASGSTVNFPIAFGAAPYYVSFIPTGTSGTNRIFSRLNGNPVAGSFSPIILNTSGSGLTETIYYIALGLAP